jgi:hypothetical protein
MEHAILVYLALALVAYPFLFMIYELLRHPPGGRPKWKPLTARLKPLTARLQELLKEITTLFAQPPPTSE